MMTREQAKNSLSPGDNYEDYVRRYNAEVAFIKARNEAEKAKSEQGSKDKSSTK